MTFIVGVILGGLVVLVWGAGEAGGKESLRSAPDAAGKDRGSPRAGRKSESS
jgi:hypothetical protein